MKINRLQVSLLFGLYDYDIDFGRQGGDFTVLTSPNGYGKTTLLNIIKSLHVKRLFFLYVLKYKSLSIWFDDGSVLLVKEFGDEIKEGRELDARVNQRRGLTLRWMLKDIELCHFDYIPNQIQLAKNAAVRRMTTSHRYPIEVPPSDVEFFLDGEGGEVLNTELAQMQNQEQFLLQLATVQTDFIGANRIYTVNRRYRDARIRTELPVLQSQWVFETLPQPSSSIR